MHAQTVNTRPLFPPPQRPGYEASIWFLIFKSAYSKSHRDRVQRNREPHALNGAALSIPQPRGPQLSLAYFSKTYNDVHYTLISMVVIRPVYSVGLPDTSVPVIMDSRFHAGISTTLPLLTSNCKINAISLVEC